MDSRAKAVKTHRKRLRSRGMRRVEVTVRAEHAALLRNVAAKLREGRAQAARIKAALQDTTPRRQASLAEALYDPVLAAPEFDQVFEEIEQSRHDPAMLKMRDVEL